MSDKKVEAACGEVADTIEVMMQVLHSRGFSRAEAVLMVAGMLASTQVYAPFAGSVGSSSASSMH
jgi:hypothetical protein